MDNADDFKKDIKEIESLIESMERKNIENVYEAQKIQKDEKMVTAKLGLLTAKNLKQTNSELNNASERLLELRNSFQRLNQSIHEGIISNEKSAWKMILLTAIMAGSAILTVYFSIGSIRETQKLTKVAQEQLDLQLQPALIVKTDDFGGDYKSLYLKNIGNGAALSIKISSDDSKFYFMNPPSLVESQEFRNIYFVYDVDISKIPSEQLEKVITHGIDFSKVKEFKIRLDYQNINNKKFFAEIQVSKDHVERVNGGQIEDRP